MNAPRTLSTALALTLALAACSTGGGAPPVTGEGGPATGRVGGGGNAGGGTAAQTPAGVTPAEYGAALEAAVGPVGSSLDDIAKSRSLKSLGGRVERARGVTGDAVDRLAAVTPPPDVTAEHSDLIAALRGLEGDLDGLRDSVSGRSLCTAPAVLARLGKGEGLGAVRTAGGDLAAKGDYPADVVDVKIPKEEKRRLSNGALVRSGGRGGLGRFTVDNGNSQDAVVTLVRGKTKGTSFYIRKNRKATIRSIPDGTYNVYYTVGTDWDRGRRAFTRDCAFRRFERPIRFRTTSTQYTTWTVTLNSVVGGNARTNDVDPDDFPS
ncbi:hypothetical protein ABGB17_00665 [Sphaerisporangium sp. B11E5]|uniref:hypothetical protein n=1 Tax=Sphaerisporangium sp. B11E5 TaxID=3153563 RepID=UPI00325DDC9A